MWDAGNIITRLPACPPARLPSRSKHSATVKHRLEKFQSIRQVTLIIRLSPGNERFLIKKILETPSYRRITLKTFPSSG